MNHVGAIDCGTNSIRLLIADVSAGHCHEVVRLMRTVRLGEGVDRTGRLSPAALERTFAAVSEYAAVLDEHQVVDRRFVATSASRDASNAAEFVAGVQERLGISPEVISGHEEAALSFEGATANQQYPRPTLVFDIGGGSTEFILGNDQPQTWASVDIGCVRLTERLVSSDPLTANDVELIEQTVEQALDAVQQEVDLGAALGAVGLAGTATTVAALVLGLPRYEPAQIDGAELSVSAVEDAVADLLAMTTAQRQELPVMQPGRADVICSGALILRAVVRRLSAETVFISERDILDGLALSLAQ
ncbi:MAG: Ppx/GppA family phosphatase [Actinomycetia bacterium]|nr:Ppx/GppA family phosphatase [Actinomycetes bacterium]